jgi:hypothetical protein
LTSLEISIDETNDDGGDQRDEDVAALVKAVPQLRELTLEDYALSATNAGRIWPT